MKELEPDVIEMLIMHELALKQLYERFAALFPDHQDFWRRIARDEQRHSDWLGALRSKETVKNWFLFGSRLKPRGIQSSIRYVEAQITRADQGGFSPLEALAVSRDLENALIEKQFSRIDGPVPAAFRPVLSALVAGTERHLQTIAEALDKKKRRTP